MTVDEVLCRIIDEERRTEWTDPLGVYGTRYLVGGHAMDTLQTLTDTFGPRMTGSANYNRAVEWAAEQFRSYGIKDVKLEPFTMANGWERGPARASMIAPFQHPLHLEAFGWTPSTPPQGTRGELLLRHGTGCSAG